MRETYYFIKIMQPISPNYNWENGVRRQTDKDYWRKFVAKLYLVSMAIGKDPSIKFQIHQKKKKKNSFTTICLISPEWIWFI